LIGVQVLGLNSSYFNEMIKSVILATQDGNKRMVIVNNNGTGIADSSFDSNKNNNMESYNKLQSFQNAKNGETALLTEKVKW